MSDMLRGDPASNPSNFEFRRNAFPNKIDLPVDTTLLDANHMPIGNLEFYVTKDSRNAVMIMNVPEQSKDLLSPDDVEAMRVIMEKAIQAFKSICPSVRMLHGLEFILTPRISITFGMLRTLLTFQIMNLKGKTVTAFLPNVKLEGGMASLGRMAKGRIAKGIEDAQIKFAEELATLNTEA